MTHRALALTDRNERQPPMLCPRYAANHSWLGRSRGHVGWVPPAGRGRLAGWWTRL